VPSSEIDEVQVGECLTRQVIVDMGGRAAQREERVRPAAVSVAGRRCRRAALLADVQQMHRLAGLLHSVPAQICTERGNHQYNFK